MSLLRYDLSGTFLQNTGLSASDMADLAPQLAAACDEVLGTDLELFHGNGPVPSDKDPLDAGFFELPERMLAAYRSDRQASELGRMLTSARRLQDRVDRTVVLGIGGSYMGARALMEGCCHPYHNELDRAERGGRPRMYFEGNNVDNDASQALLDLLGHRDEDWAIVVISKSGGTLETAVAFRQYLRALQARCGTAALKELVVPVTGKSGKLFDLSADLGCQDIFYVPDGVGGRFSILSPVGILPAAILGIDVVKLLEGAASMNDHFRTAEPQDNLVHQYVASTYLMYTKRNCNLRVLSAWAKNLEAVGLWYDQLLAESLGKALQGATPLTVVNTRDLHSRAQQHQEGARDKYMVNLIVDAWRREALPVGSQTADQDQLNRLADRTLPEIMTAAIKGTNLAYFEDGRPTSDLHIPKVDEFHLGQLFQLLMIATVVEGRLMGVNPYGQPGVEAYKVNMQRELGI